MKLSYHSGLRLLFLFFVITPLFVNPTHIENNLLNLQHLDPSHQRDLYYNRGCELSIENESIVQPEIGSLNSYTLNGDGNSVAHLPIQIDGDQDFIFQNWTGTGTKAYPCVISNLRINSTQSIGIRIQNTRFHFLINSCQILGLQMAVKNHGIYLFNVTNGAIRNCYLEYSFASILLNQSNSNEVARNWITTSRQGIQLDDANNNLIQNNSMVNNALGLDVVQGYQNHILWNVFVKNRLNAFDNGKSNFFDANYWSTYYYGDLDENGFGDVPYLVPGVARVYDARPLMLLPVGHPLVWRKHFDTHFIVEAGWFFTLQLEVAVAPPGILYWFVNDTNQFNFSAGLLQSRVPLYCGSYSVNLIVNDSLGFSISTDLVLEVWDTKAPQWEDPPNDVIFWAYDEDLNIQINAIDPSGLDQYLVQDAELFAINNTGFLTNRTTLQPNSYHDIWITVNDTWGHSASLGLSLIIVIPLPPQAPPIFYHATISIVVMSILVLLYFVQYFLKWKPYRNFEY